MTEKIQISINLDEKSLERLDDLCHRLNMNRAQVMRTAFSPNEKDVRLIFNTLLEMGTEPEL